jgi:hypothetical protein
MLIMQALKTFQQSGLQGKYEAQIQVLEIIKDIIGPAN